MDPNFFASFYNNSAYNDVPPTSNPVEDSAKDTQFINFNYEDPQSESTLPNESNNEHYKIPGLENIPFIILSQQSTNHELKVPVVFLASESSKPNQNSDISVFDCALTHKFGTAQLVTKFAPSIDIPGLPPVGFDNTGYGNCWANSLLNLIFSFPAYQKTYLEIADSYKQNPCFEKSEIGEKLFKIFEIYTECLSLQLTVPREVAQEFRLILSTLSNKAIPAEPYYQCDPSEALLLFLGIYQAIKLETWENNPIFLPVKLTEKFDYVGAPWRSFEDCTQMPQGKIIEKLTFCTSMDFEFPENAAGIDFDTLKQNFFNSPIARLSDPAKFKVCEGYVSLFQKKIEERIFSTSPELLMITLKRFGSSLAGTFKIFTKTEVPLQITLKDNEIAGGDASQYELVNFIVHIGGYGGGHYIHYRKFNNQWIELNDAKRKLISENEIKDILSGNDIVIHSEDDLKKFLSSRDMYISASEIREILSNEEKKETFIRGLTKTSYLHFYAKVGTHLNLAIAETEKPLPEETMEIEKKEENKPVLAQAIYQESKKAEVVNPPPKVIMGKSKIGNFIEKSMNGQADQPVKNNNISSLVQRLNLKRAFQQMVPSKKAGTIQQKI